MTDGTALRGTPSSSWIRLGALVVTTALLMACGGLPNREFARELDPVVGRVDRAYFIDKYGEPDRKSALGNDTEVWEYSFGRQNLNELGARTNMITTTQLRLTFRNGTFSSWQATARVR